MSTLSFLPCNRPTPRSEQMNPTRQLHDLGQSIWLDNITRGMLNGGTLAKYIADYNVTGLTSNPSIFDKAISGGTDYDDAIAKLIADGREGEELFFELALQDLTRAADLFKPAHGASHGADGFVSRSEEHTSELQSPVQIVCRLLLEKKKALAAATESPQVPPESREHIRVFLK